MKKNFPIKTKVVGAALCMLLLVPASLMGQEKMAITTSSDEAKKLFIEGREQLERLHMNKANNLFEKAIDKDPNFALAYLHLFQAMGDGSMDAQNHLDKAVRLSDQVTKGEKHMIHFAKSMGESDEKAIMKHMTAMQDLHPKDERVQMWSGYYYYSMEDYDKAIKHFKKATDINSRYHPVYNLLGYSYMASGMPDEAEKSFKKYLDLLPDEANPHDSYAEFLLNQGRFDESIKHYNKALKMNPAFVASYKGLADNYLFQGNFKMARDHYRNYYNKNSDRKSVV